MPTTIKVLGTGCANCLKLELELDHLLAQMGRTDVAVTRIDDEKFIANHLTGNPPGLMVDDDLVWPGGQALPPREMIAAWIKEALSRHAAVSPKLMMPN
jgi:hypothetical protein